MTTILISERNRPWERERVTAEAWLLNIPGASKQKPILLFKITMYIRGIATRKISTI